MKPVHDQPATRDRGEVVMRAFIPRMGARYARGRNFDHGPGAQRDTYPLSWIAQDSTKPGRSAAVATWVAQASPERSAQHLEEDGDAIATRMLPLLCGAIGAKPDKVLHAAAHRWRFVRVNAPLGLPFLRSDAAALRLGGDWCLGSRVEAAWQSGDAIARDILGGHHAG